MESCFNESFRPCVLSTGSFWPRSFRSNSGDGTILPSSRVVSVLDHFCLL